ncbi:MAG: beta-aspartyl-peptidase [Candidatus Aminicenantes bacterium]|nr:beta-aspartyl-peptidase [Candidatus Aminicenantes bacterium]
MITLLRQSNVFEPEPLGKKDILVLGEKIGAITDPDKIKIDGLEVNIIDAADKIVVPGFIDSHVHLLGGGGEGGPATRAPEMTIEDIISSGVTTVIGCLGTDGVTRHMESLLAKARGLEEEGIASYIFSGSYDIPVRTITGSVRSDLVLIDKVIGAGEIAISDHRSSQPTFEEIARLAAECRVGGMLGGKAGILHLHLGDGPRGLEMLFRLIKETEIPPTQVIPTHVNRNRQLLEEAMEFVLSGGYIDITAGIPADPQDKTSVSLETALQRCLEKQIPLERITVSSDSNGSIPLYDNQGKLLGLTIATQKDLLEKLRALIEKNILSLPDALRLFSTNAAHFYKLDQKGKIQAGKDADLLLLDKQYNLTDSFAQGKRVLAEGKLVAKGTFSP